MKSIKLIRDDSKHRMKTMVVKCIRRVFIGA